MKRQLENLDTVRVVSVVRDDNLDNGAATWTVTFDADVGDLPMLEITSGRLTGEDAIRVVTLVSASTHVNVG